MKISWFLPLMILFFSAISSTQAFNQNDMAQIIQEANQGNVKAQYTLGNIYHKAMGVPVNETEAVKWYRKAAEQGHAEAQNQLGDMLSHGFGVQKDPIEAMTWYRKAAEQGNTLAQKSLGDMYFYSEVETPDYIEAAKWYRKAAEQGDVEAQMRTGDMYYLPKGVAQDFAEAMKWYRKAAEQDFTPAKVALGDMYYNGDGTPQDFAEAIKWYRQVAEHRVDVQVKLGDMYRKGEGVSKDDTEAEMWYRKAASEVNLIGHEEARERLDQMGPKVRLKTILSTSLDFLLFPFVFYVLWGAFAFNYAAKAIIKHLSAQLDARQTFNRAFAILTVVFLPVIVTSQGGNIPVVVPWWFATLAMFQTGPGRVDPSVFPFILLSSIPFVAIIWVNVSRKVRR